MDKIKVQSGKIDQNKDDKEEKESKKNSFEDIDFIEKNKNKLDEIKVSIKRTLK